MGDPFGLHTADDAQVVCNFRLFGKEIGNLQTGVSVLVEVPGRFLQPLLLNSAISGVVKFERFSVVFCQPCFGVERIDLTWTTLHEDEDHALRFGWTMRWFGSEWVLGKACLRFLTQSRQRQRPETAGCGFQNGSSIRFWEFVDHFFSELGVAPRSPAS